MSKQILKSFIKETMSMTKQIRKSFIKVTVSISHPFFFNHNEPALAVKIKPTKLEENEASKLTYFFICGLSVVLRNRTVQM